MVGTTALFLNNVDDMVNCKDINGQGDGPARHPGADDRRVAAEVAGVVPDHRPDPRLGPPVARDLPRARRAGLWFKKNVDKDLHGVFLVPGDLKSTQITTLSRLEGVPEGRRRQRRRVPRSRVATRRTSTCPYVQTLKSKGSTFARSGSNDVSMAYFRKEAQTQGVTSVKVWDCSLACYSQKFIQTAGAAGEGQYVETFFVPVRGGERSRRRSRRSSTRSAPPTPTASAPRPGSPRCSSRTSSTRSSRPTG